MNVVPKPKTVDDSDYLKSLLDERCVITDLPATANISVIAHHAGHDKKRDDHALPMGQIEHTRLHHMGEASYLRKYAPDHLLIAMWRALGEKMYRESSPERDND
ncbi:hypothetical protein LCGC14_0354980 [marine sediment metagenome]|uniref:Uncharacterized protein n=1 Tax=marine sediment metagenome TaxID=412755 RepID=A0A0F9WHR7_9ZZZZ